ncbi:hypothetical protein GCM10007418_17360 [Halopseudomonas salina]|uniref:Uncharacterized protein n=1 Tax=Halopseudomonas salina TaxID=1323744 RepID=A0ABQ1PK51_9GAMM|nr:hypothetical protein GCM10007418_17360 [Halopseudomonas salina]
MNHRALSCASQLVAIVRLALHQWQKMQLNIDRCTAQQAQQMPGKFIIIDKRSQQVSLAVAPVGNGHWLQRSL